MIADAQLAYAKSVDPRPTSRCDEPGRHPRRLTYGGERQ